MALLPGGASPGHCYAPIAAMEIAGRTAGGLPASAGWQGAWSAAAAAEVERLLEAQDANAEVHAPSRRFVVGAALAASGGEDEAGVIHGRAPRHLADVAAAVRAAFAAGEASRIVPRLAELAVVVADLADPFQMTPVDPGEIPGARAHFADLLTEADVSGLDPSSALPEADALEAGLALAARSAARRGAVEAAFADGDLAGLDRLRRERLGAALAVALSIANQAWAAAGSRPIEWTAPAPGEARAWPNPSRGPVFVAFVLPSAGPARIELFDVAGRRMWEKDFADLSAGPHRLRLDDPVAGLPAGLYLARVSTATYRAVGRLVRAPR